MRHYLLVASVVFWSFFALAGDEPEIKIDSTSEKVYQVLADFSSAINDLSETSHCVVARGQRLTLGTPVLRQSEVVWAAVNVDARHHLHARCMVTLNQQGRVLELWSQRMQDGAKVEYRYGLPGRERFREAVGVADDKATKRSRIMKAKFYDVDPLGIAAGLPRSALFGFPIERDWLAKHLLAGRLEVAKFTKDGDLYACWITNESEDGDRHRKTEVTFGKDYGWMPVRCSVERKHPHGLEPLGESTTAYTKIGDRFLPGHCEVEIPLNNSRYYVELEFKWRFGSEVDRSLITIDSDQWLEPVRKLFDENWQRKGFVAPYVDNSIGSE